MFETTESPAQESGVYQVLARRTRPQSFAELVGQDAIASSLASMIKSKVIPHAFLFTGTRGTGKTSSARILAKSLCCANGPTETPCQTCVHCKQITSGSHDDILEIDAASNTGVDNIRDLREAAQFYPNSARYKIYIIDEVHMLSMSAFNALLKTLEEPPPNVIFILATTELHKVPLTVRSRCVIFSFRKIAPETISAHLAGILERENVTFEKDALALIAREAKGSMRDSLSLLEQASALCGGKHIELEKTREALSILGQELADKLLAAITCGTATEALETLRNADAASVDLSCLLEDAAALFRNAIILSQCQNEADARRLTQLLPLEMATLQANTKHVSVAALSEVFRVLSQGAREVSRATAGLAWAEIAVLDCISRREWLSSSELLEVLRSGGSTQNMATPKPLITTKASPAAEPPPRTNPPTAAQTLSPTSAPASAPAVPVPLSAPISTITAPTVPVSPSVTNAPQDASPQEKFLPVIDFLNKDNTPTSIRLASKLSSMGIERCDEKIILFSSNGNLFQALGEQETKLFRTALSQCGLGTSEIKGLQVHKLSESATAAPNTITGTIANIQQNKTALGASASPPIRSVADMEKDKRNAEDKARTERILKSPELKPLLSVGHDPQVLPLEDEE